MQKGFDRLRSSGAIGFLFYDAWLAECLALANKSEMASELGHKILKLKKVSGQGSGDIVTKRALAMAAAQKFPLDWEEANSLMREALELARERGARPDLAITRFRFAELLRDKGDIERAEKELDKATALFRDMEMTWWLEQAEALGKRLIAT